jgi:hypothetical protein
VSAWDPGDRVEIDSESHCYHGEQGEVVRADDLDAGTWTVLLDSGEEIEAYTAELNRVITPSGS